MRLVNRESNIILKWWYSLDHIILFSVIIILLFGMLVSTSASPYVAERIGLNSSHFYKKHIFFVIVAFATILVMSFFNESQIIKLSFWSFLFFLLLTALIVFGDVEVKGAKRWLSVFGFSLQASEFMKPFFVILNALILSKYSLNIKPSLNLKISIMLYLTVVSLLLLQPDLGMVINFSLLWVAQLYLSGFSFLIITILGVLGLIGIIIAYFVFSHVQHRIDLFLFSDGHVGYQVRKSLEAIQNGGLWGTGYAEGVVKKNLPDSHTDFVFSVIVEEFGLIFVMVLLAMYLLIIFKTLRTAYKRDNDFVMLALSGLALQIAFQVFVNIGVGINYLPTKGTTLPLISYGGSSLIATSIIIGMVLSLSRDRFGRIVN